MTSSTRATIRGCFAGLAVVAFASVFFFVLLTGIKEVEKAQAAPNPLSTWSIARVKSELGSYDTLARGEQSPLGAGSECLIYQKPAQRAVILVCEQEGSNK